jgi:hypothetical protein
MTHFSSAWPFFLVCKQASFSLFCYIIFQKPFGFYLYIPSSKVFHGQRSSGNADEAELAEGATGVCKVAVAAHLFCFFSQSTILYK